MHSFWFYSASEAALTERTFAQLQSVNMLKKQQIENLQKSNSLNHNTLNQILLETTGMGVTGETYLVDQNYQMATYSRFYPRHITTIIVKTKAAIKALRGHKGHDIIDDYRNVQVFSVYDQIHIDGKPFAIVSEIDYKEATTPVMLLRNKILVVAAITLLMIVVAAYSLSAIIVKRIKMLQEPIMMLSKGQIVNYQLAVSDKDEIGQMMESVNLLIKSFKKITTVANEIGKGNLNYYFKPLSKDDLLSYSLLKMRQQLKDYAENEKELQLQRTYSLLEGEEKERRRIARELHDSLGQMLNGLRFKLEIIEDQDQKIELKKLTDETIFELKQIINNLMPTVLADFGLEAGLRSLIEKFRSFTQAEIVLVYEKNQYTPNLDFNTSIFIYRIVQEIVNNACKHSQATKISISVDKFEKNIFLFIKDNGTGFDVNLKKAGMGLKNIQERIKLLHGFIEIASNEEGTIINIEIPL
jgi:two-component system, NarL family, sensor kinase